MEDDYERILLVKPEVFMYRIAPRQTNRAFRAAEWKLDAPDWSGRLRIVAKGSNCIIKLEDKVSGELFAACPVDSYPGTAVESVADSARYFVIRVKDESGRAANIGIGFVDRSDSFDFNVALQDHFKYLKQSQEAANQPLVDDGKKLDLSFKAGQTITINIGKKAESTAVPRQKPRGNANPTGSLGLLAPPPGSKPNQIRLNNAVNTLSSNSIVTTTPEMITSTSKPVVASSTATSNIDLLLDLGDSSSSSSSISNQTSNSSQKTDLDDWLQF